MDPLIYLNCRWFYARTIGGHTDWMCNWRRFNALARNKYGEEKILTPGRTIRIDRIKECPLKKQNQHAKNNVQSTTHE